MPPRNQKLPWSRSRTGPPRLPDRSLSSVPRPARRAPRAALVVVAALLVLTATACAGDAGSAGAGAGRGTTVLTPAPVDFGTRGPYEVGTMMLDAGVTQAVLYYPADPAAAERVRHLTSYSMG